MMKEYVCDLELAKELFKRGIVSDAYHWHSEVGVIQANVFTIEFKNDSLVYPAPIAEELLEIMPERIYVKIDNKKIEYVLYESKISCWYINFEYSLTIKAFTDEKLSNALAKMLIWLDDNGHLKDKL